MSNELHAEVNPRNHFTSNIKYFAIKKTGKSLTGNKVNNFHTELYLRFLNPVYICKSHEHQNGDCYITNSKGIVEILMT